LPSCSLPKSTKISIFPYLLAFMIFSGCLIIRKEPRSRFQKEMIRSLILQTSLFRNRGRRMREKRMISDFRVLKNRFLGVNSLRALLGLDFLRANGEISFLKIFSQVRESFNKFFSWHINDSESWTWGENEG